MGVAGSLFTQTPAQSRSCLHCQWPGCLGESSHLVMSQLVASSETRQVVILSNKTSSHPVQSQLVASSKTRQVIILSNKTSSHPVQSQLVASLKDIFRLDMPEGRTRPQPTSCLCLLTLEAAERATNVNANRNYEHGF